MHACAPHEKDRAALTRGPSLALAILVTVVSPIAAGCGGGSGAGGGAAEARCRRAPGSYRTVLLPTRSSTPTSTPTSGTLPRALLGRFPSGVDLLQDVVDGLASEGLDFETDIKPALGSELHLAVLDPPLEQGADPSAAALLRPDDGAELVELLELMPDDQAAWRLVNGWYVVAVTQADIDRVGERRWRFVARRKRDVR